MLPTTLPAKPPGSTWTDDQWAAISLHGQNILVAAAAGSGKTAVLVERIIRRISDERNPVDVDRLLVATFTKAAAAEMRQRIREALEKELIKQPKSQHLRRQLALMGRASITTLHSFCLEVIQRYYQLIGLNPGFRIANETEAELLRQDLLEEMFEQYYSSSPEDSSFWQLVDWFSGERSDAPLYALVQKLYDESRSHPWPEHWLRQMAALFGGRGVSAADTASAVSGMELHGMESHGMELPDEKLLPDLFGEVAAAEEGEASAAGSPPALDMWQRSLIADIRLELQGAADLLQQAMKLAELPGGPTPYTDNLRDDLAVLQFLQEACGRGWNRLYDAFQAFSFGKLKPCKGDDVDKDLQELVKELRNKAKEQVGKIKEELFGRTPGQFAEELGRMAPVVHTLVDLVCDFGERYRQAKSAKSLVDFADLEHYCLRILCHPDSTPERIVPSQAALDYQEQFEEILLDEYQDTNRVQEAIVELISKPRPGNRFMVGDVKQSIYRFRLAEPGLFLEKYKSYTLTGEEPGRRIDLACNFRSRRQVVDAVNFVFRQIMRENVGEIAYDERAELVYGAGYPETPGTDLSVEAMLIDRANGTSGFAESEADVSDAPEDEDTGTEGASETGTDPEAEAAELETAQLEARAIAMQIRKLMGLDGQAQPFQVFDKRTKGNRPATFRDFVVLLRATQQWAPVFIEELKQYGIPAYAELSTGYFSATEVEVMLSLLKVIDNPYQDIPLAGVLRSPVVRLSAEDLAKIRLAAKGAAYYEAVKRYASGNGEETERDEKLQETLREFLRNLERWRHDARQGSLADLIWKLYRETGFYDFVGGLPGGQQRQANLRALYDRARQYESTSFRGLFRFLRFIERMKESGGDLGTARALGEQEDVVRIMSIHKSKGLEFPVVFVAGMAKMFNQRDMNDAFLTHKELGFGPKFVDTELRVSYPTLPSLAIKRRMKMEMLAEEMRVLYVALTRAREKLILLGTVKAADRLLQSWGRQLDVQEWGLPEHVLAKAKSYLDWVGPALLRHPRAKLWRDRAGLAYSPPTIFSEEPSQWNVTIVSPDELSPVSAEEPKAELHRQERLEALKNRKPVSLDHEDWKAATEARLSWRYPFAPASGCFSKTTVSEMKRLNERRFVPEEPAAKWPGAFGIGNEAARAITNTLSLGEAAAASETPREAFRSALARRPRFMGEQKLTGAERGTAFHAVMQHLPLDTPPTEEILRLTLDRMLERELLTEAQKNAVDPPSLLAFFETDLGRRLLRARRVLREVPFSYGLSAGEVYEGADVMTGKETVMIQGVIDCLFEDEQGLVLLDYKTDAVSGSPISALRERYRVQIGLYARAVEQIWKRPVSGAYLYFFDGGHVVEL
jgi:ATP-dependent helicase/nuclease subunit A